MAKKSRRSEMKKKISCDGLNIFATIAHKRCDELIAKLQKYLSDDDFTMLVSAAVYTLPIAIVCDNCDLCLQTMRLLRMMGADNVMAFKKGESIDEKGVIVTVYLVSSV